MIVRVRERERVRGSKSKSRKEGREEGKRFVMGNWLRNEINEYV